MDKRAILRSIPNMNELLEDKKIREFQERIGSDIAEIMELVTDSHDVAVMIEGCHSCMTARGIRKSNAVTTTTTLRGRFKTDPMLQMNLFQQLHAGR